MGAASNPRHAVPKHCWRVGHSIALAGLVLVNLPTSAATVFVSTVGNEAADGMSAVARGGSAPVATVATAIKRLAGLVNTLGEPDRIVLLPGEYVLTETIRIGGQDVRNPAGLVIEAQQPGTVVLSGGRPLAPVSAHAGQWLVQGVAGRMDMVWVDGVRATRARSPNGGRYFTGGRNVKKPVPEARFLSATQPDNIENTRSLVLADDAQSALRNASAMGAESIYGIGFHAMHSWTSSAHDIKAFDAKTGVLTVTPNSQWMFFQFSPAQRFAFDNHIAFLDEPGEWLLTSDGTFRFIPSATQKPGQAHVVAARLDRLLEVSGTPEKPINGLVLRGLRFAYSNARLSPFIDSQAMLVAPPAVLVEYAQNLEIDDCAFEHIGGYALALRRGVTKSSVRRSLFDDLGAGGIRIGTAELARSAADATSGNLIENNLLRHSGVVFPGGVGIWVGQSGLNRIAHNELHSMNYSAISLGWTWAYGPSAALKNIVEANYIHNIGQGVLDDLGAIYLLGRTEGTLIKGNRIEDVNSYSRTGATAWGIYLDAGASDVVVEQNLVLRTTGGGFHLHYGHDNIVRNNIFANGLLAQAWRTAKGADASLSFERNVLVGETGKTFAGNWQDSSVKASGNLFGGAATQGGSNSRKFEVHIGGPDNGGTLVTGSLLRCTGASCQVAVDAAAAVGFRQFSSDLAGIRKRGVILGN